MQLEILKKYIDERGDVMSYRKFKKDLARKQEEQRTINELNNMLHNLEKKRDEYVQKAKAALRNGANEYNVYVALMKSAMFNISQTRDMIANFTIAVDARTMSSLSYDFVRALNHMMKEVGRASKAIRLASSQKLFVRALGKQTYSASQLQQLLKENGLAFQSSVNSLSDISDADVKSVLLDEIRKDQDDVEEMVDKLEEAFAPKQKIAGQEGQSAAMLCEDREAPSSNGAAIIETPSMPKLAESSNGKSEETTDNDKKRNGACSATIEVAGAALRPQRLKDYLGQPNAVAMLEPPIRTSLLMGKPLPHVLLCGSYGQGKTTLAKIIAKEMGSNFIEVNARIKPQDMVSVLRNLQPGDIVFADEVHQLSSEIIETILYPAMEDFELHITESVNANRISKTEYISPFTFIGATTETGRLLKPFYSKFPLKITLAEYTEETIATIISNSFRVYGIGITNEQCKMIAKRSRLSPRLANEFVSGIRDIVVTREAERLKITQKGALKDSDSIINLHIEVNEEEIVYYFDTKGIDENGLNREQRRILQIMIDNYNGGPVGQDTLAKALNVANNRVNEEFEPYLIKLGLLGIGPNGRFVTDQGFRYMEKYRGKSTQGTLDNNAEEDNPKE